MVRDSDDFEDRSNTDVINVGMNLEEQEKSKITEEQIFDSGILSDTNLLSDQFLSGEVNEPTIDDEKSSTKNIKSEELMTLDSGIDIELSDQFSSSNIELTDVSDKPFSSTELFSSSQSKVSDDKYESHEKCKTSQEQYPWQLYFIQDDDGNTQLHIAIIEGYVAAITNLVNLILDSRYLDIRNDYCQTALHLSVLTNQPQIVRKLVLSGARTNILDRSGNTALHLACKSNNLECVKALLDPITSNEHEQRLLQYTFNIDYPYNYINNYNYNGVSCVHIAVENRNLHILHQLLICGADVNIRECTSGFTVLHEAVRLGNERLVYYLLQHTGIDIERKTYARLTPYQLSLQYPNIKKMLLEKGATCLPFNRTTVKNDDDDDDSSNEDDSSSEDEEYDFSNERTNATNLLQHSPLVVVTTC